MNTAGMTSLGRSALLTLLCLLGTSAALASDGTPDTQGRFPAVAGYYELYVLLPAGGAPSVEFAEESCTASLITERVLLTAAHCTAWNYTEELGITGYSDQAWVTFDVTATANDFRCFLRDVAAPYSEYLVGEYACVDSARSVPFPRFRAVATPGREGGVAIAHGLTHPDYLQANLRPNGLAKEEDFNLQHAPDFGALILVEPVTDIAPLAIRPVGGLDLIPGLKGTPVVSVGYGLNETKSNSLDSPTPGSGPTTDLGGGSGVKRIAELGPITSVHEAAVWPRQSPQKGDDSVCYGDSGSPLFLVRGGAVEPIISGVLSGWTMWCQGSKDPFSRIDKPNVHAFIDCVIERQNDVARACRECSAENAFGLCD